MFTGKTLFAQIMDFLPWSTFHRIVERYNGDYRVRTLRCAGQFRVMAFAQLTYRESLLYVAKILSVTIFEKMPLQQALQGNDSLQNIYEIQNQLDLYYS